MSEKVLDYARKINYHLSYKELKLKMRDRFDIKMYPSVNLREMFSVKLEPNETLEDFAQRAQFMALGAHPGAKEETIQQISIEIFLCRLPNKDAKRSSSDKCPKTIQNVILKSPDGLTAKKLSKDLDKGKCRTWNTENSIRVMYELLGENISKYQHFMIHKAFLLEATGDEFWGIGLWYPRANTHPLSEIKGRNALGWMLMALWDVKSGVGLGPLKTLYQIHKVEPVYEGTDQLYGVPFAPHSF